MLPKMRYRLGLDLGSSSIGWCMVRLDANQNPVAVTRMGVRIFSDGRNPKDGTSLAVTRRTARQMRRRRDRLLKRKQRLLDALVRMGFFPADDQERKALAVLDPYVLRKKGLYEPLSTQQFARALFHINQRRGFRSNRKTDAKDNESGALKSAIKQLREKLNEENCKTLGEWLANRHEQKLSVRARLHGSTKKDRAYDFYADRAMVEHEFDTLWETQSSFRPDFFTEAAREEIKDILLHQRRLRPVDPGRCTLMPEEKRAPVALPSAQRFRIYQELNHLRIVNEDLTESPLTRAQRDLAAELLEHRSIKFPLLRRKLKLKETTRFNLEDGKRDRLNGNQTSMILSRDDCFGSQWDSFSPELQEEIVERLLGEESESQLVSWLQSTTGVNEQTADTIGDKRLPEGYGNLSRTAIARILPALRADVIPYSEAVSRAGFDSHSALSHGERSGEIMERLPYYGQPLQRHVGFGTNNPADPIEKRYGRIANPTVHIGLNELRKVVNSLIDRYGHPSEVIIEVARELKMGRQRRIEIQKEQRERQERNRRLVDEACTALGTEPGHLDKAKRRELSQKMQLWIELSPDDVMERKCPFTGEQISIAKLLSSEVEIEHILPWSRTLDDSLNNKTVAMRRANRDKGNRTPFEAFGQRNVPGYDYDAIIARAARMPREKRKRFAPDGYEQWLREDRDFLARALNDTAYLSRIAKEYLSLVCPPNRVRVIPGRMTALLRGKFGLNNLLSGNEHKTRDDHRHHAVDAAVVAVTDQGLLQRFAVASERAQQLGLERLVDEVPLPWPTFRQHVERALQHIYVSHKPDHGYQGAMHEATAWGIGADGTAVQRKRPESGGPRERIEKSQKLVFINSTRDPDRHSRLPDGTPKPYKGYVGGSNYCIEIWRDSRGRWKGTVISTYDAYQVIRHLGEEEGLLRLRNQQSTQDGKPLVMRLMINDILRFEEDGELRTMRVVKIVHDGRIYLAHHSKAVVAEQKAQGKTAGTLQKGRARHVTISQIGDLRDPGFPG